MEDNLEVIYVADDPHFAHLVKNLLDEHGIPAYVAGVRLSAAPDLAGQAFHGGIASRRDRSRVLVAAVDSEAALQIVRDAVEAKSHGLSSPELARLEEEVDRNNLGWPACPSCGRRRHTSCPVCGTAGTDFAEAFLPETQQAGTSDEQQQSAPDAAHQRRPLFVLCPTCDEPFEPAFPARCEWCGYRFADGWEPPPFVAPEPRDINLRVVITIAGLVVSMLALIAFFAALASGSAVEDRGATSPRPSTGQVHR